ncbi:MAG TPA: hypothetical protein VN823_25735 [Stellaceae bacterium]|nr:hypothetical protein [Stellaceae bacterium]
MKDQAVLEIGMARVAGPKAEESRSSTSLAVLASSNAGKRVRTG